MARFDSYFDPPEEPYCITPIRESKPRAAKEHPCAHCSTLIKKGEVHNLAIYIDDDGDGKLHQLRSHIYCPMEGLYDD